MKPKPHLQRKFLRKEILRAVGKSLSPKLSTGLPWYLLGGLTRDCDLIEGDLKLEISRVLDTKSVRGYLNLQKFGDPQLYESPDLFYQVASVVSFLKKYPFGKVEDLDPLAAAEQKFYLAEKLCRITNRRLRWYRDKGFRLQKHRRNLHSILHTARLMISRWIGPLDLNKIYDYTRHGPGGSVGVSGSRTTTYYKYGSSPYTVTTRAYPYAVAAILADPLWRRYVVNPEAILGDPVPSVDDSLAAVKQRLKVVNYNKVTFVPKTALTHRAIAVEPTMNVFLQLGVGDYLTDCLRDVGVNLRSQVRNQNLAREGSMFSGPSHLCPVTLDMSMASDTLSTELVRELMPEEWFEFLYNLRSPNGFYGGIETSWSKFSSMGNGFTFQLESMIFAAISFSVARHYGFDSKSISVYGDDIIVPRGMSLKLIETLAYVGFRINTEKSYLFGPFRESCGSDWFGGRNVRPFFLKRKVQNAKDLIFLINSQVSRLPERERLDGVSDGRVNSFERVCRSLLPGVVVQNLLGPVVQDLEGHIHCSWDAAQKSSFVLWNREYQTWSYASVKVVPNKYSGRPGPLYLQLMDGRLGDLGLTADDSWDVVDMVSKRELERLVTVLALDRDQWLAEPVPKGSVYRRKSTKLRLATLTSLGWRND